MYATTTHLPPHPYGFGAPPYAPYHHSVAAYAPPPGFFPTPFLPNHYSQFHSPPPDWPSPPTPALAPTGDPANSVMPATTLPIRPESWSPNLRTTASASRMQPDHSPVALHDHAQSLLLQDSEVNAFQHHTTLPSISASKMANAGVPDGLIAMEPSQASRTAEDFPVLCTDECTDQKDAEKSGSVLHHATPAALPDHTPSWLLDTVRTPPNRERTPLQSSFDSLHGELSKLSAAVSQFAAVMGLQTTETLVTSSHLFEPSASAPLFGNTNASSPITTATTTRTNSARPSPVCSMNPSTGTADIVPQVLGEIPTPSSWKGTHDYPLERAVPEPVFDVSDVKIEHCSNVFVDVSASPPEQQSCEEEQQEGAQLPKCISKPIFSPERPTVGSVRVFSLTEQSICDLEKLNGGENLAFAKQDKEQLVECFSKASAFQNVPDVHVRRTGQEESEGDEKLFWEKYVCRTATGHSILFFPWDPGDTNFHVMFTTAVGANKLQCTDVYKFAVVQTLAVKFSARRALIFESDVMCYIASGLGWTEVKSATVLVLAVPHSEITHLANHSLFLLSHERQQLPKEIGQTSTYCSKTSEHAITCQHSLMSTTVTDRIKLKLVYDVFCCTLEQHQQLYENERLINDFEKQHGDQKLFMEISDVKLFFTCHNEAPVDNSMDVLSWSQCPVLADRKYQLLSSKVCIWDPGIGASSSMPRCRLQSLTAATKKAFAFVTNNRTSNMAKSSGLCFLCMDAGTILPWYKFKWWLLYTEEKTMVGLILEQWSSWFKAMHYCQFFQKCSAVSSQFLLQSHSWYNTPKAAAMYHVFKIQLPIGKTSHIGDPDTMDFLSDQSEFFHQLGVKKNYNAKNLLPSQKYLQIWELDIIFITFLPP